MLNKFKTRIDMLFNVKCPNATKCGAETGKAT
jgi:hypothetical protein